MKRITDIGQYSEGDIVLRSNGLIAPPSIVLITKVEINSSIATICWKWSEKSEHYYSTTFRMSKGIADYGFWHDETTQQWAIN